jgi:hypothetical protein
MFFRNSKINKIKLNLTSTEKGYVASIHWWSLIDQWYKMIKDQIGASLSLRRVGLVLVTYTVGVHFVNLSASGKKV